MQFFFKLSLNFKNIVKPSAKLLIARRIIFILNFIEWIICHYVNIIIGFCNYYFKYGHCVYVKIKQNKIKLWDINK